MLTDLKVRTAKATGKRMKLSDFNGLYLDITPSGKKSWRMRYRVGPKDRTHTFGPYPEVSLKAAREMRDDARAKLRHGEPLDNPLVLSVAESPPIILWGLAARGCSLARLMKL